ncbi:hypothetical protein KAU40_02030 [Candidatus Parcubacteria bacterium]|nr:hypothetical protein [Candidatus Parcubacteria bacterium]
MKEENLAKIRKIRSLKKRRNSKYGCASSLLPLILFMLFIVYGASAVIQGNTIKAILFLGIAGLSLVLFVYWGSYFGCLIDYHVERKYITFLKKYETPKPLANEDRGQTLETLISEELIGYVSDEKTEQTKLKTTEAGIVLMEEFTDN